MRLFVLGATGRIGAQILQLAGERGHEVTAFVRSPGRLTEAPGLRVVGGSVTDEAALAAAMAGHDAVLSALGPPPRQALRPATLMEAWGRATVAAMARAGVGRLGVVSAAVLFPGEGLQLAFFRWLLRHHARDLLAMEAVVRASGLGFTIARPPRLIRGPSAAYRAATDALPPGALATTFRSVAAFLLDAVERGEHLGEVVGVGPAASPA